MKRIGIVTMYKNYNYGSILQCYALQRILSDDGNYVVTFNEVEAGLQWQIVRLYRKFRFLISCIRYPKRIASTKKMLDEGNRSCKELSEYVIQTMDAFLLDNIRSIDISFKELEKTEYNYDLFISGSDQIWGMAAPFLNPFMFLRFCKKSKRNSYAASLGADICPKWHEKQLSTMLHDYNALSVRENESKEILSSIGIYDVSVNCDPVMLISPEKWEEISVQISDENYALLYFLNEPNDITIRRIKGVCKSKGLEKVYYAPYSFQSFENCRFIKRDLSPCEFLGAILGAKIVFTDSYHGMLFSMIFNSSFMVFGREYNHDMPQNARFNTIYDRYGMSEEIVNGSMVKPHEDFTDINVVLSQDRINGINYLRGIVNGSLL